MSRNGPLALAFHALFIAFVLAPVTWALAYLFFDPPSTVLMMQRARGGIGAWSALAISGAAGLPVLLATACSLS